jgi:cell wall-associated NlpC family hydrolase
VATSGGVSGTAVAGATAGSLLLYAALRGVTPLQALKDVLSGHPAAVVGSSASTTAVGAAAPATGALPDLARVALTRVGDPYHWGSTGPDQFDCSGLVYWSFHQLGITDVPRTSYAQYLWKWVYRISKSDVSAGDLVFWNGHVVIATDNTHFVGAQNARTGVVTGLIANGHVGPPIGYMRYGDRGGSATANSSGKF